MKKATAMAILALAGLVSEAAGEMKLEGKADKRGDTHVWVVTGEGEVSAGETVSAEVFYVKRYKIPENLVEPGGPEYDEELVSVATGTETSEAGKVELVFGWSQQPPWPGYYRAVVKRGDEERQVDFNVGKVEDLQAARARVDRGVYEDLARIGRLFGDFQKRWNGLGDAADAGWAEWRKTANKRIDALRDRNNQRLTVEIYWMEARGKQRIGYLLQALVPLLDAAQHHMTAARAARPDNAADVQEKVAAFEDDFSHYLDFLGFGRIIDNDKVSDALERLHATAATLKAWLARMPADAAKFREAEEPLRGSLFEHQMALASELPEAFFARTERVQKTLRAMFDHVREVSTGKTPAKKWDDLEADFTEAVKALDQAVPKVTEEE